MYALSVAIRFILSKKSQTILILVGFGIGIAVNIFVGSLIQSLEADLIETTVGTRPHISIETNENTTFIENWQSIVSEVDKNDKIATYSRSYDGRAFIVNINPSSPDDIILRGMELERSDQIYNFFDPQSFEGNLPDSTSEVIIGKLLAEDLNVGINDLLEFKYDPAPSSENITVEISGIFDLGVAELNSVWVLSPYSVAEDLFNMTNRVTTIEMQVENIFEADIIMNDLKTKINTTGLDITNWKEQNESLLQGLEAQGQSSRMIQTFVLLSVVVAIASVLSITVMQKSRQIGILKAMGLNDRRVAYIFLFQGLLYGFFGSLVGVIFGIVLIWAFQTISGGADAGLFDITIDPIFVSITISIAVISSLLAAIIPARRSSNMEVIDIIREN